VRAQKRGLKFAQKKQNKKIASPLHFQCVSEFLGVTLLHLMLRRLERYASVGLGCAFLC
jgi:hypothetical protein